MDAPSVGPSPQSPLPDAAEPQALLRRSWQDAVAQVAPDVAELADLLDGRLTELFAGAGPVAEPALLGIAEEAAQAALESGHGDIARALSKRLRRGIYEFLLALDAVGELAPAPAPAPTPAPAAHGGNGNGNGNGHGVGEAEPFGEATRVVALPVEDEPRDEEPEATVAEDAEATVLELPTVWDQPLGDVQPSSATEAEEDLPEAGEEAAEAAGVLTLPGAERADVVDELEVAPEHVDGAVAEVAAVAEQPDGAAAEAGAAVEAEQPDATAVAGVEGGQGDTPDAVAAAPVATEAPEQLDTEAASAEADAPTDAGAAQPEVVEDEDLLRVPAIFRRVPPPVLHQDEPAQAQPSPETEVETAAVGEAGAAGDLDGAAVPASPPKCAPAAAAESPAEAPPQPEPWTPAAVWAGADAALPVPPGDAPAAHHPAAAPWPVGEVTPAPAATVAPVAPPPAPDVAGYAALPPLPATLPPAAMGAPAAPPAVEDLGVPAVPWPPAPTAPAPAAHAATPAQAFPIAPREGFHLTDPGTVATSAPDAGPAAWTAPAPTAAPAPHPAAAAPVPLAPAHPANAPVAPAHQGHADHGAGEGFDDLPAWRIRQSPRQQLLAERMAQKRRAEAADAAREAELRAAMLNGESGRGRRNRHEEHAPLRDADSGRRLVEEQLRRKRGAEAGALLQRLAQEVGGRAVADLALDAGDRCRALGQGRAATNCYLAAWRADPQYETPLWRLADVCLSGREIDLAVGYLERIATMLRLRGDDEGALAVYRKIATVAPERTDVRDILLMANTTGRLEVG